MRNTRWTWVPAMFVVAALVAGCADDKNGDTPEAKKKKKAAPAGPVKLVTLDLSSAGLPLTIQAPEGATAEKTGLVSYRVEKGDTFALMISVGAPDLAKEKKSLAENPLLKLKSIITDTPDTLFYEAEGPSGLVHSFRTNVKAGEYGYTIAPGVVSDDSKANMELMLKCAKSLAPKK